MRLLCTIVGLAVLHGLMLVTVRGEFLPPFVPAESGCSMAHCDSQMSDNTGMIVPEGDIGIVWRDREPVGSPFMLGCASNTRTVCCSFGPLGKDPFLKCYNGDGKELWRYNHIGPLASVSAPMIDAQGRVIACDARNIIMFDENGKVLWKLKHASGVPISPVYAENGLIIIVTTNGWIQTVDPLQGEVVGEFQLTGTLDGKEGVWATRNTPAVSGTRLYTITEFFPSDFSLDDTSTGRLFAVDLKTPEEGGDLFEIAWSLDFGARSGGSPTVADGVIYFDSDYPEPGMGAGLDDDEQEIDPHFYGVRDMGDYGFYQFKSPLVDNIRGSSPVDPLGRGMWILTGEEDLYLISPDGVIDHSKTILLSDYPDFRATHFSGIAVFGWSADARPVVLVNVANWERLNEFYVATIDIESKELLSYALIGTTWASWATGQSSIVLNSQDEPVIVTVTALTGVFAIGAKGDKALRR